MSLEIKSMQGEKLLYLNYHHIMLDLIKESMVLETLIFPEEVLKGHGNRYIAHRRYGEHLVRAIYEYEDYTPVLITVYFPYLNRYFAGGGIYEDKIFKGS
jgi:hypothetical protein